MTPQNGMLLPALLVGLVPVGTTSASDPKDGEAPVLQRHIPGAEATIEGICDQAVNNIAARYNLNEAQTVETRKLMKREVGKFIRDHEDEIWPMIRSLLASQMGAHPPESQEELMRLGKGARPLVQLAKDAIFQANEEWRQYLTEEQKKVHDFDLAEMEKTFEVIDKNFSAWAEGHPKSNPIFPPADQVVEGSPPRPPRPKQGLPTPRVDDAFKVTIFDTFVEEFIREYRLDQGQIDSARSILNEFKAKAVSIKIAKRTEFARITAEQSQARKKRDKKKIKQLEAQRSKLLQPVYELFALMENRLKGLLNTSQLEQYAAKHKAVVPEPERQVRKPGAAPPKKESTGKTEATADSKTPAGNSTGEKDNG